MPENKKQHYVPKFYLKRFSKNKKNICLYNFRNRKKIECAQLKNECYADYFYGKNKKIEHQIKPMEDEILLLYEQIDKYGCLPPRLSQAHVGFIISIVMQYSRTKHSADTADDMHDKFFKESHREKIELELKKIESKLKGANIDDFKIVFENAAEHAIASTMPSYPLLLDLNYKLLINKTKTEFVTSDNPVAMINQLFHYRRRGGNTALGTKGLQVFFPLSPDKLAILYDREVYRVGSEKKGVVEITNEQDIYNINALQACSCYENIYFKDAQQNVAALHRKVKQFRRTKLSNVDLIEDLVEGKRRSKLFVNYREDIKINPKLSFLNIKKGAKRWIATFKKSKNKSDNVLRNNGYYNVVMEFKEHIKNGKLKSGDFLDFIRKKSTKN